MVKNVREMLNDFVGGIGALGETNEQMVGAFMGLLGSAYEPNAMDLKTKELISVGIACYNRCEYCIVYHSYKAFEAGATKEEIIEAAMVSVAFGGGPSMAYSVTILKDCINEFENDFK
jgi:AhpD family alkylhydroperoxidase